MGTSGWRGSIRLVVALLSKLVRSRGLSPEAQIFEKSSENSETDRFTRSTVIIYMYIYIYKYIYIGKSTFSIEDPSLLSADAGPYTYTIWCNRWTWQACARAVICKYELGSEHRIHRMGGGGECVSHKLQ